MKRVFLMLLGLVVCIQVAMYFLNPFGTNSYDPRARITGLLSYHIPSESMAPTLQGDDYILVYVGEYKQKMPAINDVIVFKHPKHGHHFICRVIGRGGETVSIRGGRVDVDGKAIAQPYLAPENIGGAGGQNGTWKVPQGHLFVLGDNRNTSYDSRHWGNVPVADVVGKVIYIWMSGNTKRIGKKVE